MAKEFASAGDKVMITGRSDPKVKFAKFHKLDLAVQNLPKSIELFVNGLPEVNRLVYAAGFYQEGTITDLSDQQIEDMLNVGGNGLIYFAKHLLEKQGEVSELVVITSSSAWTPRKLEPIYNYIKAGAGHFANAMAQDGRFHKVLVDGQFGMQTGFWRDTKHPDWDKMLHPEWVAKQLMHQLEGDYQYKFIKVHRTPRHVEVVETR